MTDVTIAPANKPLVLRTSIGKKVAMATSGLVMVGFVFVHMIGNLKFFFGETHFDDYAHWLKTIGEPLLPFEWFLWGQRGVLLAAVSVHIWAAYSTTVQSKRARPIPYAHTDTIQANYASRTMRWGGIILLLFIVFHVLDMTVGTTHVGAFVSGKPYDNAVSGFQHPAVTIAYTFAMGALCLHLFHGIWSMLQTFGRGSGKAGPALKKLSATLAFLICLGFLSMPYAVLFGVRP